MIYGLIGDSNEGKEARTLYRSKKITEANLVSMADSVRLPSCLNSGDVVHFFEQPYLDIGNGKHWKNSTKKDICDRIRTEQEYVSLLFSKITLDDQCRWFVSRCISAMNVRMVAKTYSADGILKRGS